MYIRNYVKCLKLFVLHFQDKAGFLAPKLKEYFWNTSLVYFILDEGKII